MKSNMYTMNMEQYRDISTKTTEYIEMDQWSAQGHCFLRALFASKVTGHPPGRSTCYDMLWHVSNSSHGKSESQIWFRIRYLYNLYPCLRTRWNVEDEMSLLLQLIFKPQDVNTTTSRDVWGWDVSDVSGSGSSKPWVPWWLKCSSACFALENVWTIKVNFKQNSTLLC